ncbi:hypothetical protein EJ03DRAFT_326087 [Teratosphaeria nubilosa]|uniref:Uncharacterized protein n=1 Tax=Teratosphaeria nubilosa TaxID=161662 RepID=A0A6G1LCS8_9PEZI|nr:hypothetical protein EJ03DRAFT_326087 [Teratosphaeria nubilosa]
MSTAAVALPVEPTTRNDHLTVKDGGIVQTYLGTAFEMRRKHVPHDVVTSDMRPDWREPRPYCFAHVSTLQYC